MIGEKFGRLLVVSEEKDYISKSGGKHKQFNCICDCGKSVTVLKEHLTSGRTKSCGCLRHENGISTHRQTGTRLYRIWGNMLSRCSNHNNPAWERYGKRGISVCNEWKKYEDFMAWALSNGYADSLTIDRKNNNGNYCPENCRWIDSTAQNNNKRNNHIVEYDGTSHTIGEWATIIGTPYKTLHRRIVSLGWDTERAFTQSLKGHSSC